MKRKILYLLLFVVYVASLNAQQTEYATTGSNVFQGNQTFKSNLIQDQNAFLYLGYVNHDDTRLRISTNSIFGTYMEYSPNLYIRTLDQQYIMSFSQNGNIGIGTHSAREKLEIQGGLIQTPNNFLYLGYVTPDDTRLRISTNSLYGAYMDYSHVLYIRTSDQRNVMNFDQEGNVGIGTTSPSQKLEVNGTIRAKEVKIENTNWPDYVFSKAYKLPTLGEVSQHIEANNHLPGIPSAEQVAKEGINLSEMNAKLLQKIEEITLYMIQQEKRIETLERKVEGQK